ncbi:MAG: ABC transporter permease [Desulfuromonadaceae bacterium]|nr:ABC transporter permease [Desulfuromonas sp.]MDY0185602.1 ABC transporter permease [Desulfuromonadaceae bacterium]
MISTSLSPFALILRCWDYRALVFALIRQDVVGRYKGSVLGVLWSFFNPVFMLAVYTFVFSVVFKARWNVIQGESRFEFALLLFTGLLIFNLFAECINRAPSLILQNTTYVKKVVFPLEILPLVVLGAAFFHTLINLVVLLMFSIFVFGIPPVTVFEFPLLLVPLFSICLAGSWVLASLGVYLRDVAQVVAVLVTALMFLTPIFYPVTAVPEKYQTILYLNPLTFLVDQGRGVLIFGNHIDPIGYIKLTSTALVAAWLGLVWFQKTRRGFADVL